MVCAAPKQALSRTVRSGDLEAVQWENRAYLGALGRLHHQRLRNSGAGLTRCCAAQLLAIPNRPLPLKLTPYYVFRRWTLNPTVLKRPPGNRA